MVRDLWTPARRASEENPVIGISRRTFVAGGLVASVGTGPRAAPTRADPARRPRTTGGYFDVHVHLTQPWFGHERGPLTARQLLKWMDQHGIAQAAVLPLVSPEAFWYPISTDFVLEETAPHRDRLVPFCAIDPRALSTHLTTRQQVVDMLKRYIDAGAKGFGEHKPMLRIDDEWNMRLYEACDEVKLPLLFHLDNMANMDRPGLPGLARVLTTFPQLVFIGHGKGWWASISGNVTQSDLQVGFPRGAVALGGAVDALMDRHANLYGDLSSSGAHAVLRDPAFGAAFLLRRAERLLFGTDYYDLTQQEFQQFELLSRFDLPANVEDKIASGNARRLFQS
jgi:predicted TIM-barrel fold metal-dependent hydrolase